MGKIHYSNFETLQEIIKNINFNYSADSVQTLEQLSECWKKVIGNKISKYTKVYDFSSDNILTIVCSDSFVANELYIEKSKLLKIMKEKANKSGINIVDILFNYKKWKDEYGK